MAEFLLVGATHWGDIGTLRLGCVQARVVANTVGVFPVYTGTWCSGITPAQHAGGPGFNPQCVQFLSQQLVAHSVAISQGARAPHRLQMTAVGFEPTPLRTGAWSQRLRPLGQTVR